MTTWSRDSLRTALLQTESLFYCNLNSISIFQAVLERLLPQAGMLTVMVNTLSDARVFLGNRLLSHLLLSQRWGTQDFQANVNLQKLCKCLRPSTQGYSVSKMWFCRHIGFRTAAVICGVHAIGFFFPPRTSWKSWSWWCVARCSRWPAYKTVSCSRVSLWLPQAQVWAPGQYTHPSTQTHIQAPKGAGSPHLDVCWLRGGPRECICTNQALGKSPGQGFFSLLFYFPNSQIKTNQQHQFHYFVRKIRWIGINWIQIS